MIGIRKLFQRLTIRRRLRAGARAYVKWRRDYAAVYAERDSAGGTWFMARERFATKTGIWVASHREMRPIITALGR